MRQVGVSPIVLVLNKTPQKINDAANVRHLNAKHYRLDAIDVEPMRSLRVVLANAQRAKHDDLLPTPKRLISKNSLDKAARQQLQLAVLAGVDRQLLAQGQHQDKQVRHTLRERYNDTGQERQRNLIIGL